MQINKVSRNNTYFTGFLNNRILLKGLEKISEHGTSFAAGTSLVMSLTVRPLAILSTPDVEKENKQYACANSAGSGLIKFAMIEAIALPIENAVRKIDKQPAKYLKPETIKNLSVNSKNLAESRSYRLATQILKLGTGFVTAIPKSVLTLALIPVIMDKIFNSKTLSRSTANLQSPYEACGNKKCKNSKVKENTSNLRGKTNEKMPFTGKFTESISNGIGKILDNGKVQEFVKKHASKDKNIAKHMTAATDVLLTSSFAYQTNKSKKIKENRKKALIYNNVISTAITLVGGYGIDSLIKNKTGKLINKFSQINKADPKLHKYIEGIHIIRPALIFAGIYYGILPIFSTYFAEKIDKYIEKI